MTLIAFEQVKPGDTVGYFHKMPGITGRYWKYRHVIRVCDDHFVLKNDIKVYPENVIGDITLMDPPFPWSIEDREGDVMHIGWEADTVTLTIPGYGKMPFDIEDIERLIEALHEAKIEAEIKGLNFEKTEDQVESL